MMQNNSKYMEIHPKVTKKLGSYSKLKHERHEAKEKALKKAKSPKGFHWEGSKSGEVKRVHN
jgi:hypothetical protein